MRLQLKRGPANQTLPPVLWIVVAALLLIGTFSPNFVLSLASIAVLVFFFSLFWRPGEPPIILLILFFQWLQVAGKIFYADLTGVPVTQINPYQGDVELALWLSLLALVVVALGIRIGMGKWGPDAALQAREDIVGLSGDRLIKAYFVYSAFCVVVGMVGLLGGAFRTVALAVINLKWVPYFLFAYSCLCKSERFHQLVMVFCIELIAGFGGFFSDFKTVFYVTILAYVAAGYRITLSKSIALAIIVTLLAGCGLVWTAVKPEYRNYLTAGAGGQRINRDYVERMNMLVDLIMRVNKEDLVEAGDQLALRVMYTEFFSKVLMNVPRLIPHTDGKFLFGALKHIATPRLFFPNKPPLENDTAITLRYTGAVLGRTTTFGTSISMEYVADMYLDFGRYGMFAPLLALGILLGGHTNIC